MRFDVMPVATEKQIVEIEEVAKKVWYSYYQDIYPRDQIEYMLETMQSRSAMRKQMAEHYIYYMLLVDGRMAGYLCYKLMSGYFFIARLYIKPEYRRQGLAHRTIALFDNIVTMEEFSSLKKVQVRVARKNTFAINVYEHLGFQKVNVVSTDIGNGYICNEYVMERLLRGKVDNNG